MVLFIIVGINLLIWAFVIRDEILTSDKNEKFFADNQQGSQIIRVTSSVIWLSDGRLLDCTKKCTVYMPQK